MTHDPMLDETERPSGGDVRDLMIPRRELPTLSYDDARELLPELDALLAYLTRLRGFAVTVIEADCAHNLRTEVRIGEKLFTFRPGTAYSVERPEDLHAGLAGRIAFGEITRDELDAAIVPVDVPARIEWRMNNARLNDLAKRGGEVARIINEHRLVEDTPATLKAKGK